jgi:hypothetical protein
MLPQRASVASLRIEYKVAVITMRTKRAMPIPCHTRPDAEGNVPACWYTSM